MVGGICVGAQNPQVRFGGVGFVGCSGLRAGGRRYGGIGVTIVNGNFSVRPNSGTNTSATITADCSATEIVRARRLTFRSRAFCSESPSIKQPPSVPICALERRTFSSDITHLSNFSASQRKFFCYAGGCRLPCFRRRSARRDVRCARPLIFLDTAAQFQFPPVYRFISYQSMCAERLASQSRSEERRVGKEC